MSGEPLPRRLAGTAAKDLLLGGLYPFYYNQCIAKTPVDERKVLFVETRLDEMPDSFALVWDALEKSGRFDLTFVSLRRRSVSFPQFVSNCLDLVKELACAKYVFLCDASDFVSCLPLRPSTKVVQLWHACGAFKKWGMSTADKLFGGSASEKRRHPFYENLDVVTVSSPEVAWAYREAMALEKHPEIVRPLGVSRTDVFFDKVFLDKSRADLHQALPKIGNRKVILYAPTFRGTTGHAKAPVGLDVSSMAKRLGDDYVLLVKQHPYVKQPPQFPPDAADFAFDVGNMRIDALLACADVCITDYSSIVFEYSLFERPMAFFSPDLDEYDDWRGFYYDYEDLTPGPIFTETDALVDWVADVDERFDRDAMHAFRERFMCACDGHATERILDCLFSLK